MPCNTCGKCSPALFTCFFNLQRIQQVKCSIWMSEWMDALMRCEQDAWQSQEGHLIQTGLRSRWKNVLGRTVTRVEPWRRYNLAQPRLVPVFSVLLLYPLCSRNRFTLQTSNRLEGGSLLQLLFFLPWLCLSCSPGVIFFPQGTGVQPCLFSPRPSLCVPRERAVRLLMGLFCQEKQSLCGVVCKKRIKLMKKKFFFFHLKYLWGMISQSKFILFFLSKMWEVKLPFPLLSLFLFSWTKIMKKILNFLYQMFFSIKCSAFSYVWQTFVVLTKSNDFRIWLLCPTRDSLHTQ